MIHLNAQFNEFAPVVVMEFGKGDIHLTVLTDEDEKGNIISLSNGKEMPIGKAINSEDGNPEPPVAFMIFNKIESIDAMIGVLSEVKNRFKVIELETIK